MDYCILPVVATAAPTTPATTIVPAMNMTASMNTTTESVAPTMPATTIVPAMNMTTSMNATESVDDTAVEGLLVSPEVAVEAEEQETEPGTY